MGGHDLSVSEDLAAPLGGVGVVQTLHVGLLVEAFEEREADDAVVGAAVEGEGGVAIGGRLGVESRDAVGVEDFVDAVLLACAASFEGKSSREARDRTKEEMERRVLTKDYHHSVSDSIP